MKGAAWREQKLDPLLATKRDHTGKGNPSMRLFVINLLAASMLVFSVGTASAIEFTLGGADGQDVEAAPGTTHPNQVTVTVVMDTEATDGITVMSIGVLFDDTRLSYNQGLSAATSYALYRTGKNNNFIKAAVTCGGYPGGAGGELGNPGCALTSAGQVNLDYVSTDLTVGTNSPQNTTAGAGIPNSLLAELVFDVLPEAPAGTATIVLTGDSPGNVIGQPGGASTTATFVNGVGSVNVVPEPGVAGLMLVAIASLGGLRGRGRRQP